MTLKSTILKHIENNPGVNIYYDDIAEEFDVTNAQISGVVAKSIRDGIMPGLEFVGKGIIKYKPNGHKPSGRLYEEIGRSKNDVIIVQDEDGNLYRVEEL